MAKLGKELIEKLNTVVNSMGYEFVGGEIMGGRHASVLRLYIDRPGGVTIDNCSEVSRQLGAMLDVDDPFEGKYRLEVSSPGIDRPLFMPEQYEKFIGETVYVKLHLPVNGRRQFKGVLLRVENGQIELQVEGVEKVEVPFSAIDKANLVAKVDFKKTK